MAEKFRANELLECAVQIEKNGEAFYRAAAGSVKDAKVKELFGMLADEEVKHAETYSDMLKSVETYEPKEVYPDEYFAYLKAYADEHIFVKKEEVEKKASAVKSDVAAIDMAIGAEKDSILYYLEMKNFVPAAEKPVIDKVIEEERRHYNRLTGVKNSL